MKNRFTKATLTVFIVITLFISALPQTLWAFPKGNIVVPFAIIVNDEMLYGEDWGSIPPRSIPGAQYNHANKTLTLNNFTGYNITIQGMRDLNIVLIGKNTITTRGDNITGINAFLHTDTVYYHATNITIKGGGSLVINAMKNRVGMVAGNLHILEGCSLNIKASYKDQSRCIDADGIYVDTASGASVWLYAQKAPARHALNFTENVYIKTSKNAVIKEGATPEDAKIVKKVSLDPWESSKPFVSISKLQKVTSISLSTTSKNTTIGQKFRLKASAKPVNATDQSIVWQSSNPKAVTVDEKGNVKTVGLGTAYITAKNIASGKLARCKISVKLPVEKISAKGSNKVSLNSKITKSRLSVNISPSGASKDLSWKSSNPKIVKVDTKGYITAMTQKGKATVTATATDGSGKKATFYITVR